MSDLEIYHRNQARRSKPLDLVLSTSTLEHLGRSSPVPDADDKRRAVQFVAAHANDAAECAEFLDMLGLDPAEGKLG